MPLGRAIDVPANSDMRKMSFLIESGAVMTLTCDEEYASSEGHESAIGGGPWRADPPPPRELRQGGMRVIDNPDADKMEETLQFGSRSKREQYQGAKGSNRYPVYVSRGLIDTIRALPNVTPLFGKENSGSERAFSAMSASKNP